MDWHQILSNIAQGAGTSATILGTLVTAVATVFLWRVTGVLAVETRRMADASAKPQVVVNIEPNQWAMNHADIVVANTGNATAFEITVSFNPPIERDAEEVARPFPMETVSLLKPGQSLTSYLSAFQPIIDKSYRATVSWKRDPSNDARESISYQINLNENDGRGHLGAASPITQIADEVKKFREDWRPVAQGSKKVTTDVFTSGDRLHEQRGRERWRRKMLREQAARQSSVSSDSE